MNLRKVCRVCVSNDRTMFSLLESLVPKFDSPPHFVVELWNILKNMLITNEASFPDNICSECFIEIQRMYYFVRKCERSGDILKKMINSNLNLKNLKIASISHENSSNYDKSENDLGLDTSQIKTEIEEVKIDAYSELLEINLHVDDNQVDPLSEDPSMVHFEEDYLDSESDDKNEEASLAQVVKQENELDVDIEFSTEFFNCTACRYKCSNLESLEKHVNKNHMEGKVCKICNKGITNPATEYCFRHLRLKSTEAIRKTTPIKNHKCRVCSKEFHSKCNLKQHLIIHTRERPFKCEICSKTFRRKNNLTSHLTCHSVERPLTCESCPKMFSHKSSLRYHLKTHTNERPFHCEICLKTFRHQIGLRYHLKTHTGERPFKCKICLKTYKRKNNLTDHLKYVHDGIKRFKCDICSKAFGQKGQLRIHLISHTGERAFKCEICSKTFGQKCHLTTHLLTHFTKEKPFKCDICSMDFRLKSHLVQHSDSHGVKDNL